MARLILLNGPPGVGKSTLARMYAHDRPLALNLDVDVLRALLGDWRGDPHRAGLAARAIALAAARTHLAAGHDVVVPQFLARVDFIDQLAALPADFHEYVLMDSLDNVRHRFAERDPSTVDVERVPPERLAEMYDRLTRMLAGRPDARIIRTGPGQAALAYQRLLDDLDRRGNGAG